MSIITNPKDILPFFPSNGELEKKVKNAEEVIRRGHIFKVTEFYLENVIKGNPDHPLLDTIIPNLDDLDIEPHLSNDDKKFSKSKYLIQKYTPNAILLLTNTCAQKCTYCFRKEENNGSITESEMEQFLNDLEKVDSSFIELVLSGGESLLANPRQLYTLSEKIGQINTKRKYPLMVDIHTRLPVVAPYVFNNGLFEIVERINPTSIDLHIIHPDEITSEFKDVCMNLYGIDPPPSLRTIHPILKGINDNSDLLSEMYIQLGSELHVFPRDIILPISTGAGPMKRIKIEEGMQIARELYQKLPGHLLPRLVVCSPKYGKSYVDPFHLKKDGTFGYDTGFDGNMEGLFVKDGSCQQKIKGN